MVCQFNAVQPMDLDQVDGIQPMDVDKEITFVKEADVAQYGGSDYSNAIRVERGISLEEAFEIAENDPDIDYFVYLKGGQMVLTCDKPKNDPLGLVTYNRIGFDDGHVANGYCRIFRHGDTVFFKNEGKWLGSAPGYADVYSKQY